MPQEDGKYRIEYNGEWANGRREVGKRQNEDLSLPAARLLPPRWVPAAPCCMRAASSQPGCGVKMHRIPVTPCESPPASPAPLPSELYSSPPLLTPSSQGYGIFWSKNGDRYEGEWVGGKRNGKGRQTYGGRFPDGFGGDLYEGEWLNDKRHGLGFFEARVFVHSRGDSVQRSSLSLRSTPISRGTPCCALPPTPLAVPKPLFVAASPRRASDGERRLLRRLLGERPQTRAGHILLRGAIRRAQRRHSF